MDFKKGDIIVLTEGMNNHAMIVSNTYTEEMEIMHILNNSKSKTEHLLIEKINKDKLKL